MIVETNNFRAMCHSNNIVYLSNLKRFTPKAGQCLHGHKVPLLYGHNHNDLNAMIGIAELRWCPDDCKIDAICKLDDNAKNYLIGGQTYSLDVLMTDLKTTSAGNIQNYIIREVSIVPHESLPEHEEIIFKFLEGPVLKPNAEIKWSEGNDGRDAHYYISYSCPVCKEHLYVDDCKCNKCNTRIDWSKKAYIEYTRYIEWR